MSRRPRRDPVEWAWEQALIDAYYDYRWREALGPLAKALHRWEAGEGDPVDVAREAARLRKAAHTIDYLFSRHRDYLIRLIEFHEEWSAPWLAAHPRPVVVRAAGEPKDQGTA